jgi:ABC-type transport system involved in cytochrome bd biosynthesis fused ATPase/permease subunit
VFQSPAFWILQALFTGYICLAFLLILPCWLYRILVPVDPELLATRDKYFEEAYDHLNFWSSIRMAQEAEHQYLSTIKNKAHREDKRATSVAVELEKIKGFKTDRRGSVPITVDLNMENHFSLNSSPVLSDSLWRMSFMEDISLS